MDTLPEVHWKYTSVHGNVLFLRVHENIEEISHPSGYTLSQGLQRRVITKMALFLLLCVAGHVGAAHRALNAGAAAVPVDTSWYGTTHHGEEFVNVMEHGARLEKLGSG